LCCQFLIFQILSLDQFLHGIPEHEGVFTVTEPPFQFIKVGIQVPDTHMMERTDNRSLQKAPYAFNGVGIDFSADIFILGVIDRLMPGIMVSDASVGGPSKGSVSSLA
jgi:hypothetical protein